MLTQFKELQIKCQNHLQNLRLIGVYIINKMIAFFIIYYNRVNLALISIRLIQKMLNSSFESKFLRFTFRIDSNSL